VTFKSKIGRKTSKIRSKYFRRSTNNCNNFRLPETQNKREAMDFMWLMWFGKTSLYSRLCRLFSSRKKWEFFLE